jgi:hypothetical protein
LAPSKPKSSSPTMFGWRSWAQARLFAQESDRGFSGGASGVALHHLDAHFVAEVRRRAR